jgi:multiple sugar transport system permease protein
MVLLAGLQAIPHEPYESAKVDGASSWGIFRHITLPMLRPAILIALLIRTMVAFKAFDVIYVMTMGGPGNATNTLTVWGYAIAFDNFRMSDACALATVMLVIIILISNVYSRYLLGEV